MDLNLRSLAATLLLTYAIHTRANLYDEVHARECERPGCVSRLDATACAVREATPALALEHSLLVSWPLQ